MPCTVDVIPVNRSKDNKELLEIANFMTHWLDKTREKIIAGQKVDFTPVAGMEGRFGRIKRKADPSPPLSGVLLDTELVSVVEKMMQEKREYVTAALCGDRYNMELVNFRQQDHRREDIKRLRHTFIEDEREDLLAKTFNIDYTRPLAEQLGFDPDDY